MTLLPPQKDTCAHLQSLRPSSPQPSAFCFCRFTFTLEWSCRIYSLLHLVSRSQRTALQAYPSCCSANQYFLSLAEKPMCLFIHQLLGTGLFWAFDYYKWCCPDHLCKSCCRPVFMTFGELLGRMVNLTFKDTAKEFSKAAAPLCIPTSAWGFQFLHIFANICYY